MPPDAPTLLRALGSISLSAIPEAVPHYWAVAGSYARGEWQPGSDIDLRLIYSLPASDYLGLTSFWDEAEQVVAFEGLELDIVAFEIGKLARLLLKGHEPTLEWLGADHCLYQSEPIASLRSLAILRNERLGDRLALPPAAFETLDKLVSGIRLGAPVCD